MCVNISGFLEIFQDLGLKGQVPKWVVFKSFKWWPWPFKIGCTIRNRYTVSPVVGEGEWE